MSRPLHIDEFRAIAAMLLRVDEITARQLVDVQKAESALNAAFAEFGGYTLFGNPVHRAAVTCSRLNRNHALPDFNKRASVIVLGVMLDELGLAISAPPEAFAAIIERLANDTATEDEFVGWVERNVAPVTKRPAPAQCQ